MGAVALWWELEARTQSQDRHIDITYVPEAFVIALANALDTEFACGIIRIKGMWNELRVFCFPAKLP